MSNHQLSKKDKDYDAVIYSLIGLHIIIVSLFDACVILILASILYNLVKCVIINIPF